MARKQLWRRAAIANPSTGPNAITTIVERGSWSWASIWIGAGSASGATANGRQGPSGFGTDSCKWRAANSVWNSRCLIQACAYAIVSGKHCAGEAAPERPRGSLAWDRNGSGSGGRSGCGSGSGTGCSCVGAGGSGPEGSGKATGCSSAGAGGCGPAGSRAGEAGCGLAWADPGTAPEVGRGEATVPAGGSRVAAERGSDAAERGSDAAGTGSVGRRSRPAPRRVPGAWAGPSGASAGAAGGEGGARTAR